MNRLNKEIKKELITQIKKGISINNISRELSIAKSTIYYHYKKIKGRRYKRLNIVPNYSKIEGEIVGIFAGDGSQYFEPNRYKYEVNVHFGYKNKKYALYVKKLYEGYFGKNFELKNEKNKKLRLKTSSKEIYNYFHHYLDFIPQTKHSTIKLKKFKLSKWFKTGFLKGFVDTDGSVYFKNNKNKIGVSFYTTSRYLAYQLESILNEFGFKYGHYVIKRENWKPLHNIQLLQQSVETFLNIVKPFKTNRIKGQ
jgi:hypothetical protein